MEQPLGQQFFHLFPAFMLGGVGMVFAGVILESIQRWPVFILYSEVLVMVPALLGLKGNIEMTLASRLSTSANTGVFANPKVLKETVAANLAVSQLQAIVVGFLSAVVALICKGNFSFEKSLVLITASVLTASATSLILGSILSLLILISSRIGVNPDNVATPVAASLGDFCTLWILSRSLFLLDLKSSIAVYLCLLFFFFSLLPLLFMEARKHASTVIVLRQGWWPVLLAMCISSCGGLILKFGVQNLPHLAAFQPLMNGLGGNIASIQASRLSTTLHKSKSDRLSSSSSESSEFRIFLIILSFAGQFLLCCMVVALSVDQVGLLTIIVYMAASTVQVLVLLSLASWLVPFLWNRGEDPDNAAIPYLTSVGDLLGTGLLTAGLFVLPTGNPQS